MIMGKFIGLREIKIDDASVFFKWLNDQTVIRNMNIRPPKNIEEEIAWIESYLANRSSTDIILAAELLADNKTVGICGLHKIDHLNGQAEFDFIVGEASCRGKGYGTQIGALMVAYAFSVLGLRRIYTGAYSFNQGSIKALSKIGFTQEGRQREAVLRDGTYHDNILFGLLRTEWQKTKDT